MNLQQKLPINSEKAKSEFIIAPILTDIWEQSGEKFSIHSGINLEAESEQGLNGECDFYPFSRLRKKLFFEKSDFYNC